VDPNNHTIDISDYNEPDRRYHIKLPLECAHPGLKELVLFDCSALEHEMWDSLARRKGAVATGREICRYIDERQEDTRTMLNGSKSETNTQKLATRQLSSIYGNQATVVGDGYEAVEVLEEDEEEYKPTMLRTYHMQARSPESNGYMSRWQAESTAGHGQRQDHQHFQTWTIKLHVTHRVGTLE
jgi:hypothetical protein